MRWCPKFKINVEENWKGNCPNCIFWKPENIDNNCDYNNWKPGLKKGKDLSNEKEKL